MKCPGCDDSARMAVLTGRMVLYAFRYALGRMSTAPFDVAEFIRANHRHVSPSDLRLIVREINDAKNAFQALGQPMDAQVWLTLADDIEGWLKEGRS